MAHPNEKLIDLISHGLGWVDHNMRRDRPYGGQPHTFNGERGQAEVKGVTFRDLRDCFVRAICLSTGAATIGDLNTRPLYEEAEKGEHGVICEDDIYQIDLNALDPMAIIQNMLCEVERITGTFPNVPELDWEIPIINHRGD